MRGAKADASQSQTTTTPRSDRSDRRGDVSGALTTYYDDLMMGDDGGAAARGPAQSGRGEQEAGWRDRMEVAAAATQVNTWYAHAPHRRCTARTRSRFASHCIRHARTRPPRHARGAEGRGGRAGCPFAGWVHAGWHGGRQARTARARATRTCTVRRTDVRLRRGLFSRTAGVTYVPDSGRREQQAAGVGFVGGFAKVLLKDFSAAKVLLKVF